jgi:hypothetical protein
MLEHESLPLCFDFLPDRRLVIVSNQRHTLLTVGENGNLVTTQISRACRGSVATTSSSTVEAIRMSTAPIRVLGRPAARRPPARFRGCVHAEWGRTRRG